MVLRLDDTDVERNTDASVQSIFEGLRWLGLDWDEEYKQSERLALHRQQAEAIFAKGLAYRDFTPAHAGDDKQSSAQGAWLFNPGMRELSREESDRRAAAGEPFALRYRVPRGEGRTLQLYRRRLRRAVQARRRGRRLRPAALGRNAHLPPGLLRRRRRSAHQPHHPRPGSPHQHLQAPADLRGPRRRRRRNFAHLPLLVAPDGAKLSKRKHGPVVSVTTYRDAGFLPRPSSTFSACSAGRPRTTASS